MSYMQTIESARLVARATLTLATGAADYPGTAVEVWNDGDDEQLFDLVVDSTGAIQVLFWERADRYRMPPDVSGRIVAAARANVRKVD